MPVSGTKAKPEHRASNGAKQARLAKPRGRSKLTNHRGLLPGAPHRDIWSRRFRDLTALHVSDLGSEENIACAEHAILRRCVTLQIELERREVLFAQNGGASDAQLQVYQQASNSLRRLLQALGLQRRTKQIGMSLGEVLREDHEQQLREQRGQAS